MHNLSASEREVIRGFDTAIEVERISIADVIERLKEIIRRRIYLKLGYSSPFLYLTKGKGYPPASAQRRIDAARISEAIPQLKKDLESGDLNLLQVAMLAQAVRQSQKEKQLKVGTEKKMELLNAIKGKDIQETQKFLAQSLDIEIKTQEKKRIQKDLSMRVEMTLNPETVTMTERAKELLSHKHPNPELSELYEIVLKYYIDHEDPLRKKAKPKGTSIMEAAQSRSRETAMQSSFRVPTTNRPSASVRRQVFQKFSCCQWKCLETGKICGSRLQLQTDHIIPLWAGGTNDLENLHLLCGPHNRHKYRMEAGLGYR